MHNDIQTRGFSLTDSPVAYVNRPVRSALATNDRHILRAQVMLMDINGPRGGVDRHCQFNVTRGEPPMA